MTEKTAKAVRVFTVAPVLALVTLLILRAAKPEAVGGALSLGIGIFCLTVLPLLAYPLQPLLPGWRDRGRTGQRDLAIVFAVVGYVLATLYALASHAPEPLLVLCLTYLFSGAVIAFSSGVLQKKASGHACGVAGPIVFLAWYVRPILAAPGALLLGLVYRASLSMRRHTLPQLIGGTLVSVGAFFCALAICGGLG